MAVALVSRSDRLAARFSAKVNTSGPVVRPGLTSCHLWTGGRDKDGYGSMWVGGRNERTHRVAMFLSGALEDLRSKTWVLHKCDNPPCCNTDHLFLGTARINTLDAVAKNRFSIGDHHWTRARPERLAYGDRNGSRLHPESRPRGEKHTEAKLTDNLVREMRDLRGRTGISYSRLGEMFGVSKRMAILVVSRKNWKHVP